MNACFHRVVVTVNQGVRKHLANRNHRVIVGIYGARRVWTRHLTATGAIGDKLPGGVNLGWNRTIERYRVTLGGPIRTEVSSAFHDAGRRGGSWVLRKQ
jgi:hypothetical protein